MRRILMMALAGAALSAAAPAYADTLTGSPCSDFYVNVGGQSAIACVGYYNGNLLTGGAGSATPSDVISDLNVLLTDTPNPPGVQDSGAGYSPPYSLNVSTILDAQQGLAGASTFTLAGGTVMSGLTVLGLHFGNSPDSPDNNVTAFWLFNLVSPSNTITLTFPAGTLNGMGSSNVQLYSTGMPVPEPATWAMMLLGFGGIGLAMRRSRRRKPALMQVA